MSTKKNEIQMTEGPLAKKILLFALPLALSSMLQQLFNAADLAVVGRFANSQSMAAVGSNSSVIALFVSLFAGLSIGANVVIGNMLGSGNRKGISDAVHTIASTALISGAILFVLGMFLARPILLLMGAPEDVINLASVYLRIYFCGMPAIMMYNFCAAILRARGDSRRPFVALVIAGIMNVILNLIFVAIFQLHVIGVALATVISNYFSGGLTMSFLIREDDEFKLSLRQLRIKKNILLKVIKIGLPAGIQGMVFSLSNVVIQSAVNSFGSDCISGMTAAQNFDFLSYCLLNAFAQTCVTFTSQNYGAAKLDRCKKVWSLSMGLGIGIDIVFVALMYIFRYSIILIFTKDPAIIYYAMFRIEYAMAVHFLCGTYEITAGALRGMNRSSVPAIISIVGTCAVRLLYIAFIFPMYNTPKVLMLVYPISWIITGISMNTAYFIVRRKEDNNYLSLKQG